MLKLFNRKKKDNKGFTLVELVIVVAILAILVGILAPQYTKYVEKSRQAADASNLENIVEGFKVAAAYTEYEIIPSADKVATFVIKIAKTGTTITATDAVTGTDTTNWIAAIKEYTGFDFKNEVTSLKLKSSKWVAKDKSNSIQATVKIDSSGAVSVAYDPETVKDAANKTNN